jgi:hypothetical protein
MTGRGTEIVVRPELGSSAIVKFSDYLGNHYASAQTKLVGNIGVHTGSLGFRTTLLGIVLPGVLLVDGLAQLFFPRPQPSPPEAPTVTAPTTTPASTGRKPRKSHARATRADGSGMKAGAVTPF